MTREEVLHEVRSSIDSMRKVLLVKALGILALGIVLGVSFVLDPDRIMISELGLLGNQVVAIALSLVALGMAGHAFLGWKRSAGDQAPIYLALRDDPQQVVWVYPTEIHRHGVHYRTEVWICLRDRAYGAFSTKPKCDELLAAIRALAPRATFGYSPDLAARFQQDPSSLLAST